MERPDLGFQHFGAGPNHTTGRVCSETVFYRTDFRLTGCPHENP